MAMTDQQVELSIKALNCKINRVEAEVAQGGGGSGSGGGPTYTAGPGISISNGVISATAVISSIGINLDGGGSILTTGQKGYIRIPFNATITGWSIIAREVGSATFDVWKSPSGTKPTVANTITASAKPTLTGTDTVSSTAVGTWGTGVNITA